MSYQYKMEKNLLADWLVTMDVADVFNLWFTYYVTVGR